MLIGLISCSKAKTAYPAPARLLYGPSALFRGALASLTGRADFIYVLSAKYGLVTLDQVLEPYNLALKEFSRSERTAWAKQVVGRLLTWHGAALKGSTCELHAGAAYRDPLEALLIQAGATCICPVDGLTQGRRLAFYRQSGPDRSVADPRPVAAPTAVAPVQPAPVTFGMQTGWPRWLATLAAERRQSITVSVDEIEAVLGEPIAASYRNHAAAWYGAGHPTAQRWERLGWRASPQLGRGLVTFHRSAEGADRG